MRVGKELRLERDFVQADLAKVRELLRQSPPDEDPIEHFQFRHRIQELEERLQALNGATAASRAP